MGDISESRILITAVSFIGIAILLINSMPSEFVNPYPYTGQVINVPASWTGSTLTGFAANKTQTLNDTGYSTYVAWVYDMTFGGRNFDMLDYKLTRLLQMKHYDLWGGFWHTNDHFMSWLSPNGTDLGDDMIASYLDYDYANGNITKYKVSCDHTYFYAAFSFDTAIYSKPSDAWNANALTITLGMSFDQLGTSLSAWALISMILFFNMPMMNPTLNAIIAIPLWIAIIYVGFIIVLRAIGAVFGGGGA